jgi:hypothetical protein
MSYVVIFLYQIKAHLYVMMSIVFLIKHLRNLVKNLKLSRGLLFYGSS